MAENGNGIKLPGWIAKIPSGILTIVIAQFVTLIVWAVRLDQRVVKVESEMATVIREDTEPGKAMAVQLRLIEDRQRYIINYLLFLREELSRVAPSRVIPPFNPPPAPPEQEKK